MNVHIESPWFVSIRHWKHILSDFTLLLSSHGYVLVMLWFLLVACQSYNRTFKNSVNSEYVSVSQSTEHVEMTKEFVVWPAITHSVKPSLLHIQEHLHLTDRRFLLLSAFLVHSTTFQLPRHVKATCEHIRCILYRDPDNMLLSHSICSIPWCFSGQYFTPQCTSEVQDQDSVRVFGTRLSWHSHCAAESKCQFILNVHLSFLVTTHLDTYTVNLNHRHFDRFDQHYGNTAWVLHWFW